MTGSGSSELCESPVVEVMGNGIRIRETRPGCSNNQQMKGKIDCSTYKNFSKSLVFYN